MLRGQKLAPSSCIRTLQRHLEGLVVSEPSPYIPSAHLRVAFPCPLFTYSLSIHQAPTVCQATVPRVFTPFLSFEEVAARS